MNNNSNINNEEVISKLYKIESYYLNNVHLKDFHENLNKLDKKKLNEILKKKYLQSKKDKNNILKEIKYKKNWVNPGNMNEPFAPFDVLKPKVLSMWEQLRVNMPERSYERYPVSKAFRLDGKSNGEFGFCNDKKQLSEQYVKYLDDHMKKYHHYIDRPSHFVKKERFLPQLLDYKPPFKIQRSSFQEFTQLKHNTFIYENKFRMNNDK